MQSRPMYCVYNVGKPSHNPTETATSKGYSARFKFGSAELIKLGPELPKPRFAAHSKPQPIRLVNVMLISTLSAEVWI